jgi:hexosaminidase
MSFSSHQRTRMPLLLPQPARIQTGHEPPFALAPEFARWLSQHSRSLTSPAPAPLREHITGSACGSTETQRYSLRITSSAISIHAATPAAVRHARATLRQLARTHPQALPACEIQDAPVFPTRGVMLDVSRCRIPTMQELLRIIDTLCDLKCNHLQLYTEHTFAYQGHEPAWQGWSALTPDEVLRLDAHCQDRGIVLAANQNCFGHLAHWLRMPEYAHLAETHGDWVFDVWPRTGPFSLCPTDPRSLAFVRDLFDQLLPCFSSPLVNIGCDETYDIAFGRSKEEVARRGRAAVYLDFVAQIADLARAHNKQPMMWGDIALSHPECVPNIPQDMICLAWGYEPDAPFAHWCRTLKGAGREVWVCPGTSSWCSITGRTSERIANIHAAATQGAAHGATGLLICDWGDHGHWQQWPITLRGLADGLSAAWTGSLAHTPAHAAAVSLHAFDDATNTVAPLLDALGDADLPLRETCLALSRPGVTGRLRNQSALFADVRTEWASGPRAGDGFAWISTNSLLQAQAQAAQALPSSLLREELLQTAQFAQTLCARALARRGMSMEQHDTLIAHLDHCRQEHQRLWRIRCREGGLPQSTEYFDRMIQQTGANA